MAQVCDQEKFEMEVSSSFAPAQGRFCSCHPSFSFRHVVKSTVLGDKNVDPDNATPLSSLQGLSALLSVHVGQEVYRYKTLPFGLYTALAVFTGMMVSSGKLAREMKLNVLAF